MGRKYIRQIINQNFVYPNNEVPEYDLEIVQDINDNSVSGTVTSFTATTVSYSAITFQHNFTWSKNNAETFIQQSGLMSILSVHMMAPGQNYFKPWRLIDSVTSSQITATTINGLNTINVTPAQMGLTTFTNGTYYFEFRFIGHRAIYPICLSYEISSITPPTPTPTATPTPTPVTPTPTPVGPTPTPTPVTPTPTPSSGKSIELRARDIASIPQTITMFYNVNSGGNINIPGGTSVVFPISCSVIYTITGLTTGDVVIFGTSIACAMEGAGGTGCPGFVSSLTTYSYVVDAPSVQTLSLTIDTQTIP